MSNDTLIDIKTFVSEGKAHIAVEFDDNRRYSYAVTQPISAQNVAFALHRLADMIMPDTESNLRGSGRTTRQLRDAPIGAVYVVTPAPATPPSKHQFVLPIYDGEYRVFFIDETSCKAIFKNRRWYDYETLKPIIRELTYWTPL